MAEQLGARQSDLARVVADRLDSVGARLGAGLDAQARTTGESLGRLNERLAVIDAAQSRLTEMTREVVSLKDILANKQARGAFGQGRMEAIVRDGLPAGAFDFQFTLSNRARPDCVIRLPGDSRLLAVDAKFPLESFSALRAAGDDEMRKGALARVRADVGKHVKDIAERYLLPGETQDIALMFVPSEAIYSDLVEHFDDVVQKAHRARVVIVSPTLMVMAINVAQAILRDARMRDEAQAIQAEVGRLLNDVRLIVERAGKLETHFAQAQDDLNGHRRRELCASRGAASGSRRWTLTARGKRRRRAGRASSAWRGRRSRAGREASRRLRWFAAPTWNRLQTIPRARSNGRQTDPSAQSLFARPNDCPGGSPAAWRCDLWRSVAPSGRSRPAFAARLRGGPGGLNPPRAQWMFPKHVA